MEPVLMYPTGQKYFPWDPPLPHANKHVEFCAVVPSHPLYLNSPHFGQAKQPESKAVPPVHPEKVPIPQVTHAKQPPKADAAAFTVMPPAAK